VFGRLLPVVGGEFTQRARLSRNPALLCQLQAKTLEPLELVDDALFPVL
jgi:hypothetical protein